MLTVLAFWETKDSLSPESWNWLLQEKKSLRKTFHVQQITVLVSIYWKWKRSVNVFTSIRIYQSNQICLWLPAGIRYFLIILNLSSSNSYFILTEKKNQTPLNSVEGAAPSHQALQQAEGKAVRPTANIIQHLNHVRDKLRHTSCLEQTQPKQFSSSTAPL